MMLMKKAAHESEGKTRLVALAGVASELVAKAGNGNALKILVVPNARTETNKVSATVLYTVIGASCMRDILYFSESYRPSDLC